MVCAHKLSESVKRATKGLRKNKLSNLILSK
jgi:hypothetical protein